MIRYTLFHIYEKLYLLYIYIYIYIYINTHTYTRVIQKVPSHTQTLDLLHTHTHTHTYLTFEWALPSLKFELVFLILDRVLLQQKCSVITFLTGWASEHFERYKDDDITKGNAIGDLSSNLGREFAFHYTLMLLGNTWLHLFSLQLRINYRKDWVFGSKKGNQSRRRETTFKPFA